MKKNQGFKFLFLVLVLMLLLASITFYFFSGFRKDNASRLKLGTVNFDVSTHSIKAKTHFNLGLRYLHNFMYPAALREFEIAKELDPYFAMSYWGIAMSYNRPLWSLIDKALGLQILYEFHTLDQRKIKLTEVEKGLLAAVYFLYDPTVPNNDYRYLKSMEALFSKFPNHPEVISFYALAKMGYVTNHPFDKTNLKLLEETRALLKPYLQKYPQHPGINHYYIHASDVPDKKIAEEGLVAIQNIYANISDSSHILHMPSHLYNVLGEWDRAVETNKHSMEASHRLCNYFRSENIYFDVPLTMCGPWFSKNKSQPRLTTHCDADNLYHSAEWMHYALLKKGDLTKANQLIESMLNEKEIGGDANFDMWLYRMQARHLLLDPHKARVASLPDPLIEYQPDKNTAGYSETALLFAYGLNAVHFHQVNRIKEIENRMKKILAIMQSRDQGIFWENCILMQKELAAAKAYYLEKNVKKGKSFLQEALNLQTRLTLNGASLLPIEPVQELYAQIVRDKVIHQIVRNKGTTKSIHNSES